MVLGTSTAGGRRASAAVQLREVAEGGFSGAEIVTMESQAEAARALHERLVAYVHAVAGEARRGDVWVEHSYARARDQAHEARELLAARAPPDCADVDVERLDPAPPPPLEPSDTADDALDALDEDEDASDDWEAKVAAIAPSAAHARLAAAAADTLRGLRLARLAGGPAAEHTRAAARRLRMALAPLWVWSGAPLPKPAPWLHAALLAHLPRSLRQLYEAMVSEMRRTTPRLAERLAAGRLPAAAEDPLAAVGPARGPEAPGPLLVWVGVGAGAADARWTRRLAALLHLREVRASAVGPPDAWCAQVAASIRTDLQETITEAGSRGVVVCGCGAGAALAAALLSAGGAVAGAALLAPPLLTAEGEWSLRELRAPALLVAGSGAAGCWRGAARRAAGAGRRRLLLVAGADDALTLPHSHRARLRLPQHALDAAIVEEVYRWALEAAELSERAADSPEHSAELTRPDTPPAPVAVMTTRSNRSIEIVEGRVVTRVSGNTPLALLPPRRARRSERSERAEPPSAASGASAPSAADILHMPIVFADDAAPAASAPLTVTSGDARGQSGRITRVIVAKRGRPPGAGPGAGAGAGRDKPALVLRRTD
ncbi:KAT8 regulatory NSL complex subunit 3 [Amyelois transitella]|uniref:KAT8 regulatory NSL complex subunit 3 n=1 Tax=Amyelois transitella TaxID=680683 RepID=UPI00298FC039|nr:KAT8 regulatory NSL complex subunit 3 [Amyelois transitella]